MAALKKQICSFFPSVKIVFGFDLFLPSLKFTELYLCYHAFEKNNFLLSRNFTSSFTYMYSSHLTNARSTLITCRQHLTQLMRPLVCNSGVNRKDKWVRDSWITVSWSGWVTSLTFHLRFSPHKKYHFLPLRELKNLFSSGNSSTFLSRINCIEASINTDRDTF